MCTIVCRSWRSVCLCCCAVISDRNRGAHTRHSDIMLTIKGPVLRKFQFMSQDVNILLLFFFFFAYFLKILFLCFCSFFLLPTGINKGIKCNRGLPVRWFKQQQSCFCIFSGPGSQWWNTFLDTSPMWCHKGALMCGKFPGKLVPRGYVKLWNATCAKARRQAKRTSDSHRSVWIGGGGWTVPNA